MTIAFSPTLLKGAPGHIIMPKGVVQQHYVGTSCVATSSRSSYERGLYYGPPQTTSSPNSPHQWNATSGPSHFHGASASSATALPTAVASTLPPHRQETVQSSRKRRLNAPPKNSTDALAKWFAELISWIWFSPPSSSLVGASRPMTPVRSPAATFTPYHPSPLASSSRRAEPAVSVVSGEDQFAMLEASSAPPTSSSPWQPCELEYQPRRGTAGASGWSSGLFDESSFPDRRLDPQDKFVAFIRDTIKTTQVSTSVLILALLYVQRLKLQHPKLRGQEGSEYRLSVIAMMLGNKFLDDHTYTNKTWSEISSIPLKDITKMEIEFWLGLQMRIHVHQTEYEAWVQTMNDLSGQRSQALLKKEQRDLARRKTAAQQISPWPYIPLRCSFSHGGFSNTATAPLSTQSALPLTWSPTAGCVQQVPPFTLEFGGATSPSPVSQHSPYSSAATASSVASTYATSALPLGSDNVFGRSPEQRRMSARKLSPFSTAGQPACRPLGLVSAPCSALQMTGWQVSAPSEVSRQSVGGNSGSSSFDSSNNVYSRKRGRDELLDAGNERGIIADRESKRISLSVPTEVFPHGGYPSRSYCRGNSAGGLYQDQLPLASNSRPATPMSRDGSFSGPCLRSTSRDNAFYRSVFADPLTPDCLTQSYIGPEGLPLYLQGNSDERGLAFYQLAAGKELGLPALHLPPPAAYLGGVNGYTSSMTPSHIAAAAASRRGSLSWAPCASSPRASWSASEDHHVGSISMSQSPSRSYVQGYSQRPVRLSPEAYGMSYGGSAPLHVPAGPLEEASSALGGTSFAGPGSSREDSRRRWIPFSNVPMNMQLEQMKQWHHIQYQQKMRAQEEEERRRRSIGCHFTTGRH